MSRISTGFHRIGVVLAAPLLCGAVGIAIYEWWTNPEQLPICKGLFDEFIPNGPKCRPIPGASNDGGVPMPIERLGYRSAMALAIIGVALYLISKALGWIISGFAGEPKK